METSLNTPVIDIAPATPSPAVVGKATETATWRNGGSQVAYRTEPDMEKRHPTMVCEPNVLVRGVQQGEWLATEDGMYLPLKHPATGADMLTLYVGETWYVTSAPVELRTEKDLDKRSGFVLQPGEQLVGFPEDDQQWFKTTGNMYMMMKHPATGAPLIAPVGNSGQMAAPGQIVMGSVPPGAAPGGQWQDENYFGPVTGFIYCCLCWCIVFCPVDGKQVYVQPDGKKINSDGTKFGWMCGQE
jgi:hypothetical protein